MSAMKVKTRNIGAKATISRMGQPDVSSFTGGSVDLVTSANGEGFNPLDLLFASLSSCLALSLRIAASEMALLDRFQGAKVDVTGVKSDGEIKRIERFLVFIVIEGDFTPVERESLIHRAEQICTVSNTLKVVPTIELNLTDVTA